MTNWSTSLDEVIHNLYQGILNRDPDIGGYTNLVSAFHGGLLLKDAIQTMLNSEEYLSKQNKNIIPSSILPNLIQIMPDKYINRHLDNGDNITIFYAINDSDFYLMEDLIWKYRYYDAGGVWSPIIDIDKRVTCALVQGLGANSCLELGCFTGPVLSLLKEKNIDVVGLEVSHLAFVLSYQNIKNDIIYGDLLSVSLDHSFDVILAMDIIEHLNPLKLNSYIDRIASLLNPDGYLYLNSPMFGFDRVFGNPFPVYIEEWGAIDVQNEYFWRQIHCDELGWPMHGHLVWASPVWWEKIFSDKGLIRDIEIEEAIHNELTHFFINAPGRKSLFVLKHKTNIRNSLDVICSIKSALSSIEGLM